MIYAYVLFMIFPIYNTIDTLDKNQVEAARDLGGSIWKIHTRVVIPHAKPGIAVGSIMTFMLSGGLDRRPGNRRPRSASGLVQPAHLPPLLRSR